MRKRQRSPRVFYFGRFDLRIERLVGALAERGELEAGKGRRGRWADFARKLKVTQQAVHQWRWGKTTASAVSLIKIGRRFGVSLDWLVGFYSNEVERATFRGGDAQAARALLRERTG